MAGNEKTGCLDNTQRVRNVTKCGTASSIGIKRSRTSKYYNTKSSKSKLSQINCIRLLLFCKFVIKNGVGK